MLKNLLFLLLLITQPFLMNGQGCSDAGFCTMGAMRPNQTYSKIEKAKFISLEISNYSGFTKFHDRINTIGIDANFSLHQKYIFQLKLPYTFVDGPLAKTQGLGDISISFSTGLFSLQNGKINLSLGTKLPTGKPNKKNNEGITLPTYYQTTLGTYDVVFGLSYINKKWLLATGIQIPLTKADNNFKWGLWKSSNQFETAKKYPVSDNIYRGTDIMLRLERNFRSSKWNFHIGMLSIYRINKDKIVLPATGQVSSVDKSDGLVLNVLAGIGHHFNTRHCLKLLGGKAVIKRSINPDGLSREYVTTLAYEWTF